MAVVSAVFLLLILISCFIGPLILDLPDPNAINLANRQAGVSWENWMGTDHLGRDIFSRILDGGQISLLVALVATAVSSITGLLFGAVAGFVGGKVDALMMRLVDVLYALPFLVMVILFSLWVDIYTDDWTQSLVDLGSAIGFDWERAGVYRFTSLVPLFVAIGALGWLNMARIARAQVISVGNLEFVEAARSLGLRSWVILFKHILPNCLGPVIVYTTLTIPSLMLFEAILSFLGLGVKPPNASWGILIKEGADRYEVSVGLLLFPTLIFSLTLLALNFLGDGLRDALDPKSSKD